MSGFTGYVIGVGASAGGLEALERFFDHLPSESGSAIVVIQHLSPDHKTMMDNLLSRHTRMPVVLAGHDMQLEANHVYLIPPGKTMTVAGTKLCLAAKDGHGLSLPIDLFFSSMAKEFSGHSVGVVLSGTGSDGTRGAVAINDAGGFLLAQNPDDAKFDGMPRSIIATGLVDEILSVDLLARRVYDHVTSAKVHVRKIIAADADYIAPSPMEGIFHLLQEYSGINFRDYKIVTIQRRIERRMQIRMVRDLSSYLQLLKSDRNELATLKRDVLIPVTRFFRDTESFETLEQTVIPAILQQNDGKTPIRVWVAACSTGEEAYSIAILFAEAFEKLRRWPELKIFATDLEQDHVDVASAGVYAEAIANEISPERLSRYFIRTDFRYTVSNQIRQSIVFARHNLLDDPPFTRMTLGDL